MKYLMRNRGRWSPENRLLPGFGRRANLKSMKSRNSAPLLRDLAYERILEALFEERLPKGGRVSQNELVEETGIPVGPVRDALKVLEADGIVEVHPRSGVEVIRPSTDLVRTTFQFRTIIERPAARAYAMSAGNGELIALIGRHEDTIKALGDADPGDNVAGALSELETEFHMSIVGALDNQLVDKTYYRLQLLARIVKTRSTVFANAAVISLTEHLAVLEACQKRNADAAGEKMTQHLTNALNRNLGIV